MNLIFTLLFFVSSSISQNIIYNESETVNYLKKYGYIKDSFNALTDLKSALVSFQERYNLIVDGTVNNETLQLFKKPRCQHPENEFRIHGKWKESNLKWYFPNTINDNDKYNVYLSIIRKVFKMWQDESNLKFEMVNIYHPLPNITIFFAKQKHQYRRNCQGIETCPYNFDGPGKILGHSFFPSKDSCIEIHLDMEENWYAGLSKAPEGSVNLLSVLAHEVGHALGLGHSDVKSATMFPWYQEEASDLSEDDKMALESLYGRRRGMHYMPIPKNFKPIINIPKSINKLKPATNTSSDNENVSKKYVDNQVKVLSTEFMIFKSKNINERNRHFNFMQNQSHYLSFLNDKITEVTNVEQNLQKSISLVSIQLNNIIKDNSDYMQNQSHYLSLLNDRITETINMGQNLQKSIILDSKKINTIIKEHSDRLSLQDERIRDISKDLFTLKNCTMPKNFNPQHDLKGEKTSS